MIRRFTSAKFVPANAGAKAKNPVGSTLFSTPMVALLRHPGHKILRTSCHESARKRLKGSDTAACTVRYDSAAEARKAQLRASEHVAVSDRHDAKSTSHRVPP